METCEGTCEGSHLPTHVPLPVSTLPDRSRKLLCFHPPPESTVSSSSSSSSSSAAEMLSEGRRRSRLETAQGSRGPAIHRMASDLRLRIRELRSGTFGEYSMRFISGDCVKFVFAALLLHLFHRGEETPLKQRAGDRPAERLLERIFCVCRSRV